MRKEANRAESNAVRAQNFNMTAAQSVLSRRYRSTCLIAALLLLSGSASLKAQNTEARARQIEARFVSPCCWRENLAVHGSQVADELRGLIAAMVRSGQTEPQIVDYMVARFGERILRGPRGTRFRFLNLTPIVALAIGLWLLVRFLKRSRHLTPQYARTLADLADEDLE